ncbi:MAG: sulfite exporter TauE/SafE family protein, partial [Kiritimatiellae bacterium]|nr:sulfite exporter TauE/SafE family protein [Kiritimatiellia bacterium]
MTILSAAAVAAYLGVFCAISPCPLATNIAAVGFVSRGLSPVRTLLGGLLYATGRAAVYVLIAVALVSGIAAAPELSHVLQK